MIRPGEKNIGEMTHADLTQFIGNILATQSPEKSTSMQQVDVHSVLNVKDKMNLSPQAKAKLLGAYLTSAAAAATYETQTHAASTYAPLASPTFTGTPTAPTPGTSDNSTQIATTAYVKAQGYVTTALTSFNGRSTAAVVPTTGDYTAAMVTNAADKSSVSQQTFSGSLSTGASGATGSAQGVFAGTNGQLWVSNSAAVTALAFTVPADAGAARFLADTNGQFTWGTGAAGRDTTLERSAANTLRATNTGLLSTSPTVGLGYGTGAGGTVTQLTSKATGVTLSKVTGRITMNTASLTAGTGVNFIVTNTAVTAADSVVVSVQSSGAGTSFYTAEVIAVGAGSFTIRVTNVGAVTEGAAVTINFTVVKGATA